VPQDLKGILALAAGSKYDLALKSNRTVVAWDIQYGSAEYVPEGLSGVGAIAVGAWHYLALKLDGTVAAWGDNFYGQTNVPAGLTGVIAIAAGQLHSLALKSDGTVVAWGSNYNGQSSVPNGLTGVTAIAAGANHSLALKSDGTVVAWGDNSFGASTVPAGLGGVIAVAGGHMRSLVLVAEPSLVTQPATQTAEAGSTATFRATAIGGPRLAYRWLFNGSNSLGCTTSTLQLDNVLPSMAGSYTVTITNACGAITSVPAFLSVIAPVPRRVVPGLSLIGALGSWLALDFSATVGPDAEWVTFDNVLLSQSPQWYFDLLTPRPAQGFYRALGTSGGGRAPVLQLAMVPALTLMGPIGSQVRVDAINQYGPTNAWFSLATVTLTNTTQLCYDVSAPGAPTRLYRLVPGP
jgi:hypothetical protein